MPEPFSIVELGPDDAPAAPARPELRAPAREPGRAPLKIEFGRESPATFFQRLITSLPRTTEGKVQFLEGQFGKGNVKTTPGGEILVAPDPSQPTVLVPFDESGFNLTDITADIAGPALEVVPAIAGSSSLIGAAAGGAAGSALRSGAAELVTGGESGETLGEMALEMGTTAALSGAAQQLVKLGAVVFDAIRPGNFVARQVRKAKAKPFAKKGERLTRETGIPLTVGEETGSRATLMVEAIGRRTPAAADDFFAFHQGQLRTAMGKLQDAMENVRPGQAGSFQVGTDVTKAFDEALESAVTLRRAQAKTDFGEVTRLSAGQKVIPTKGLVGELQKMADELDVPGLGNAAASRVRQLKKIIEDLTADGAPTRLTGDQAQSLLANYTKAQRGLGTLFSGMDKAESKFFAGRLKDAFLGDLDDAVQQSSGAGAVANALRAARDRYRVNSAAISEISDGTLARLIGNRVRSPEAIAEKIVRGMQPSEVRGVMALVDKASPETAQAVRRLFIENAIIRAKPAITQQTAEGVKFSAAKFLANLPEMETMKAAGFSRAEIVEIGRIAKALERVADKAFEGSPTAFASITWDAIRGLFTLNPVTLGRAGVAVLAPRRIARATLTPEGRQALTVLTKTGQKPKTVLQAFTTLTAIMATEPGAENVRPLGPDRDDAGTMEQILELGQ